MCSYLLLAMGHLLPNGIYILDIFCSNIYSRYIPSSFRIAWWSWEVCWPSILFLRHETYVWDQLNTEYANNIAALMYTCVIGYVALAEYIKQTTLYRLYYTWKLYTFPFYFCRTFYLPLHSGRPQHGLPVLSCCFTIGRHWFPLPTTTEILNTAVSSGVILHSLIL